MPLSLPLEVALKWFFLVEFPRHLIWRDKILVEASVSTKVLLIWEALKKVVTYKGLSPSTTRLAKSLAKKVTDSLVSWYTTYNKLPSEVATPWLLSTTQIKAYTASLQANGLKPVPLRKELTLSSCWILNAISVRKSGFVSYTKHTVEATNIDLFHSWLITCTM